MAGRQRRPVNKSVHKPEPEPEVVSQAKADEPSSEPIPCDGSGSKHSAWKIILLFAIPMIIIIILGFILR